MLRKDKEGLIKNHTYHRNFMKNVNQIQVKTMEEVGKVWSSFSEYSDFAEKSKEHITFGFVYVALG